MAKTKEISRRIKSVSSTKKITKAMEMVAAAKMRRAIEAVLKTRSYASLSWETVLHLADLVKKNGAAEAAKAGRQEVAHPLLTIRSQVRRVAVILITSNRGMCGGYNAAVIAKAEESLKKYPTETDFIIIGKKGAVMAARGHQIAAEFSKNDVLTDIREIQPLTKMILDDYQSGRYDKVLVAYTDFVSPAKQIARLKQILPIDISREDEQLGAVGEEPDDPKRGTIYDGQEGARLADDSSGRVLEYKFEPDPQAVLSAMIPRLLEMKLYQAHLEANASEHSARMSAMHQATEAATDMVAELTLFYNKARQAGITAEIAEISAGANALAD